MSIDIDSYVSGRIVSGWATSQCVHGGGGISYKTIIKDSGRELVYDEGTASATVIRSGGGQIISNGGRSIAANISSGGEQYVEIRGVASNTKITFSGTQYVSSGGYAYNTNILNYGSQSICSYGRAYSTVVNGSQSIDGGGVAKSTSIKSGGVQIVSSFAKSYNIDVFSGGELIVNGGIIKDVSVYKRGVANIHSAAVRNLKVKAGGSLCLSDTNINGFSNEKNAYITFSGTYNNIVLSGDKNTLSDITIHSPEDSSILLQNGSKLVLNKNVVMANTSLSTDYYATTRNADLVITGQNNIARELSNVQEVTFDLKNIKSANQNKKYMLILKKKNDYDSHSACINVDTSKNQKLMTYKLTSNLKLSSLSMLNISVDGKHIYDAFATGGSFSKNGVTYIINNYSVKDVEILNLGLSIYGEKMYKGSAKTEKLAGTANSDIFYGGKGNDALTGKNGRDVAVYDKTAWGKDTIAKTNGTMTLLFKDLKSSDIVKKLSGTTMTITRKGDSSQKITVKGWSNDTHNIVFGGSMTAFNKYLSATSPTTQQKNAARNEVWKKAGLASA